MTEIDKDLKKAKSYCYNMSPDCYTKEDYKKTMNLLTKKKEVDF